eukprot:g2775.t1
MMPPAPGAVDRWSYIDAQGNVQGPFTHEQLMAWVRQGHFCSRTLARREGEPAFRTLMSHGLLQRGPNDDEKEVEETLIPLIGTCWYYIDSNGVKQGPFDLHKMREWSPRFFDGETLVRCGDSSTSEFVPLRTTVIAQTLDNEAFSRTGFFGGQTRDDEEGSDKVGSSSCGPENADTASSGGVRGVEIGSNSSANEVATTNMATRGDQHSLDVGFDHVERRAAAAEERARIAEECMASAQRELAASQERFVEAEKKKNELVSKLDASTRTLREKTAIEQELKTRVETLTAEVGRLQVFEVAFSMMKDGIDLIHDLDAKNTHARRPVDTPRDSKSSSKASSPSFSSGSKAHAGSSGPKNFKKGRRSNPQAKAK